MNNPLINKDQHNLLFFYDLPKTITAVQIANLIKTKTGIEIDAAP